MLLSDSSRRVAASALLVALTACGGGVSIGFNIGDNRDLSVPSVSIAASASSVQAGQPLTLVAAASDPSGIDSVAFYRVDGNTTTLLGSDGSAPYEWPTVAPTDGRSTLSVFARATDNTGNRADSQVIAIAVTP